MKILLVEDNQLKREKVKEFIQKKWNFEVHEALSYNSAIAQARKCKFDFIVLDMSMPTFDRTINDMGGRFRTFGGKEIATKLKKFGILPPFVVVTGYSEFKDDSGKLDLVQVGDLLGRIGGEFKGIIPFESSNAGWQEALTTVIEESKID